MEQTILSTTAQHIQHNKVIRSRQHGFRKGRYCLSNLISICEKMTSLVYEAKAVYLSFSKELILFPTVFPGETDCS